jgi:hypothetical protein
MPKTVPDQVIERFRAFAKELFAMYGEPKSFSLVVDWATGNTDPPAGVFVPRNGANAELDDVMCMYEQSQKFTARLSDLLQIEMGRTMQDYAKLRAEVVGLEQRKRELLAGPGTQGPVGPDRT